MEKRWVGMDDLIAGRELRVDGNGSCPGRSSPPGLGFRLAGTWDDTGKRAGGLAPPEPETGITAGPELTGNDFRPGGLDRSDLG